MDVVGGGGKAAGAAHWRLDWPEYTRPVRARKSLLKVRSGYPQRAMRTVATVVGVLIALAGLVLALDQWFNWGIFGPKIPPVP